MGIPHTLHTPRLKLRPVQREDLVPLHQHWAHPGVRRYLWDGRVIPYWQTEETVAESGKLFARYGYGLWSLHPLGGGTLMGCGGFWFFHGPPQLELVLSLDPLH